MLIFTIILLVIALSTEANIAQPQVLPPIEPNATVPQLDGRIIGGYDAAIQDHPYQLSLTIYDRHYCGGVLISSNWGLTASHCTRRYAVDLYGVVAGTSIYNVSGTRVSINKFIDHPQYNGTTYDYDIALIQFASPIEPNGDTIQTISLATSYPKAGATALVSGWGYKAVSTVVVAELQALKVPIVSLTTCRTSYGQARITDRMLCAGYTAGGKDACSGDSGGPLVVKNDLVGLVSFGRSCAVAGYPGVYANIAYFVSWIKENSGV